MDQEPNYLKRYKQLFARYVDIGTGEMIDLDFKARILEIRQLREEPGFGTLAHNFIKEEYKFPSAMYDFVRRYIRHDEINFDLIEANLYLVAPSQEQAVTGRKESLWSGALRYVKYCIKYEKAKLPDGQYNGRDFRAANELKLVIGKNATIEQIVDFIRTNKDYVKQFQGQLKEDGEFNTAVRPLKNLKRDMRIRELKEQGKRHREIAATIDKEFPETRVTYGDIPTILRNLKK